MRESSTGCVSVSPLTEVENVANCSTGQRRKLAVALALPTRCELLLLDEPAAGLDPIDRYELMGELLDALSDREATVVISSHLLSDLDGPADQIVFLENGGVLFDLPWVEAAGRVHRFRAEFPDGLEERASNIPGALFETRQGPVVRGVSLFEDRELFEGSFPKGVKLQVHPIGLEDLFIDLQGPRAVG